MRWRAKGQSGKEPFAPAPNLAFTVWVTRTLTRSERLNWDAKGSGAPDANGSEAGDAKDDAKGSDALAGGGLPNAPPKAPPKAPEPNPGDGGGAGASAAAAPRRRVPDGAAGAPKPAVGIDSDMVGTAAELTVAGCEAVSLILMTNFFFLG